MHHLKYLLYAICIIISLGGCDGCNGITDPQDTIQHGSSGIQPAQPFFSDMNFIFIESPANGSAFDIDQGEFHYSIDHIFLDSVTYSFLLILDSIPNQATFFKDFQNFCVSGITNYESLHRQHWNISHGIIDSDWLFSCDQESPNEMLSPTFRFSRNSFITGKTYYWLIIGYNKFLKMTHASSLRQFIIHRSGS